MTRVQVRKVSNPSGVKRVMRGTPKKVVRRNMSEKQIKHFGTKRQKAALAKKRAERRTASSSHRPRTQPVKNNPAWLVTLGPVAGVNPNRRKAMPASTKKKRKAAKTVKANRKRTRRVVAKTKNPRKTRTKTVVKYRYKKSNPKVVVRYRAKKRNSKKRVIRKNPEIFGSRLGSKDSLKLIGGGLIGVAAVKFVPTMLPAGTIANIASSSFGKVAVAVVVAVGAGWGVGKLDKRLGEGVMFGGLMMAAAVAINVLAPSVYTQYLGMGDFVPGRFPVPQNPVRAAIGAGAPPSVPAASGRQPAAGRLASAYQPAY